MAGALSVDVGDRSLAFAVTHVRAVLSSPSLTRVPTAPDVVVGLANVRGDVVPVLDLAVLLGGEPGGGAPFVLVVDTDAGPAGLAVTAMPTTVDSDAGIELVDPDVLVRG